MAVIPSPPVKVLTLVSTGQPELFHQPVTLPPVLLLPSQNLSYIIKEIDRLLETQVGYLLISLSLSLSFFQVQQFYLTLLFMGLTSVEIIFIEGSTKIVIIIRDFRINNKIE